MLSRAVVWIVMGKETKRKDDQGSVELNELFEGRIFEEMGVKKKVRELQKKIQRQMLDVIGEIGPKWMENRWKSRVNWKGEGVGREWHRSRWLKEVSELFEMEGVVEFVGSWERVEEEWRVVLDWTKDSRG